MRSSSNRRVGESDVRRRMWRVFLLAPRRNSPIPPSVALFKLPCSIQLSNPARNGNQQRAHTKHVTFPASLPLRPRISTPRQIICKLRWSDCFFSWQIPISPGSPTAETSTGTTSHTVHALNLQFLHSSHRDPLVEQCLWISIRTSSEEEDINGLDEWYVFPHHPEHSSNPAPSSFSIRPESRHGQAARSALPEGSSQADPVPTWKVHQPPHPLILLLSHDPKRQWTAQSRYLEQPEYVSVSISRCASRLIERD